MMTALIWDRSTCPTKRGRTLCNYQNLVSKREEAARRGRLVEGLLRPFRSDLEVLGVDLAVAVEVERPQGGLVDLGLGLLHALVRAPRELLDGRLGDVDGGLLDDRTMGPSRPSNAVMRWTPTSMI